RRRHTRFSRDWSSDVCSSDLAWKDPARVQIAHDEVLAAVNDLLPGIYRLEDLTRLPVMVSQANSQANSGVLTDNQNGVYGAVLRSEERRVGEECRSRPSPGRG